MFLRLGLGQNGVFWITCSSSRLVGGWCNKGILVYALARYGPGEGGRFVIFLCIFMCCRSQGRNNVDRKGCGEQGDAVNGPCY